MKTNDDEMVLNDCISYVRVRKANAILLQIVSHTHTVRFLLRKCKKKRFLQKKIVHSNEMNFNIRNYQRILFLKKRKNMYKICVENKILSKIQCT